jgi:hypothetical protein
VRRLLHRLVQGAALVARSVGALQRHDVEALLRSSAATVRAISAVASVLSSRIWMCSLSRGQSSRAAASTPRRTTGPSLNDGICTTTCGSSASGGSGVASRRARGRGPAASAGDAAAPCRAGCR